jgi:hypothetical protein
VVTEVVCVSLIVVSQRQKEKNEEERGKVRREFRGLGAMCFG